MRATCTKRIRSWRWRSASITPLMPSPGMPKTRSMPQSIRVSTRSSAPLRVSLSLLSMGCLVVDPSVGKVHTCSGRARAACHVIVDPTRARGLPFRGLRNEEKSTCHLMTKTSKPHRGEARSACSAGWSLHRRCWRRAARPRRPRVAARHAPSGARWSTPATLIRSRRSRSRRRSGPVWRAGWSRARTTASRATSARAGWPAARR